MNNDPNTSSDEQDNQDAGTVPPEEVVDTEASGQASVDAAVEQEEDSGDNPLEALVAEHKEELLRVHAEMENVRRRSDAEVDKARKFALERFARELLPVVDSLEKALESTSEESAEASVATMKQGVEMTLNMLIGALNKFRVEVVDPVGEPFDPQFHEAMSMVEAQNAEPNTVINVVQKGYTLNSRLIRPAMVIVSKASPTMSPGVDETV